MWFIHSSLVESIRSAEAMHSQYLLDNPMGADTENPITLSGLGFNQNPGPEIYSVVDGVATIAISGVLTKHYSYFYGMVGMGSTGYADIVASIAMAENNPDVEKIQLYVGSGGGRVDGLTDAIDAITAATKPVEAIIDGMAASAAYAIAAAADNILALRTTDMIGSVGVVQGHWVYDDLIPITNRASPNKRPDVTTPAGVAVVQDELDPLHELIIAGIAQGRSAAIGSPITAADIDKDFGAGSVMVASKAIKAGMIDGMVDKNLKLVNNENQNSSGALAATGENSETETTQGANAMNEAQLKKDHPELHSAIYQSGVTDGVKKENQRCADHLTGGKLAGQMDKAIDAVKNGTEMTSSLQMEYMAGAQNNAAGQQRSGENVDTGNVDTKGAGSGDEKSEEEQLDAMIGGGSDSQSYSSDSEGAIEV